MRRLKILQFLNLSSFVAPTGISFDLSDKELFCIEEQDVFDRVYSLIRGYNNLPPSCKVNLLDSLRSNLSVLLPNVDSLSRVSQGQDDVTPVLDRVASHRNAFTIYTFFLLTVVLTEESNIASNNNVKVFSFSYISLYLAFYLFLLLKHGIRCVQACTLNLNVINMYILSVILPVFVPRC